MMAVFRARWVVVALLASCGTVACAEKTISRSQALARARHLTELGRKMFFDPSLSASGAVACATCHDPAFAYGPPNASPVQRGGKTLQRWGTRATPSLRYLQAVPQFTEHYFDTDNGDDSVDAGPTGGLTWDGRADRGRDQARIPLLSPDEMANANPSEVVARVRRASYVADFRSLLNGPNAFAIILEAFEAFEQDAKEFYPYSSKFDAWLAGGVNLGDGEMRGLRLFTDETKGNCARCHLATRSANGSPPAFTDYGFVALGLPRNPKISANADPQWYDLGLCGPQRIDLKGNSAYCGRFRTPSLRNVALRKTFFHNGVFDTLTDAVAFYARRDTNPEKWYSSDPAGSPLKFDDLPKTYQDNVDQDPPFGKAAGAIPVLTDAEIEDIVAFLETLTDGFRPGLVCGPPINDSTGCNLQRHVAKRSLRNLALGRLYRRATFH
jgi:cytochrome c peroxidase